MIKYEVPHQLMNNLKAMLNILHQNQQNFFSSAEVCIAINGLNNCKPIAPKPLKNDNKIKEVKEAKNDKK